ncbi:MAG: hypothetical protein J6A02_05965 [Prevotella sp.]|nr:hypothetical protein [Prevotella sp.]
MFSYQQTFFKPTEVVTEQLFYDLVRAPYTAQLIDSIRHHKTEAERLAAEGNASEAKLHEQEAAKLKKKLPAFMFQATFDESLSKKGMKGCWRKQAAARLTGLVVMDIDHVSNPVETFQAWGIAPLSSPEGDTLHLGSGSSPRGGWKGTIVLVYITPSGKGLKVVFKADPERGNLIDNQHWMARELGVEIDESCKDASRMSFICKEQDILFINKKELFNYENKDFSEKYNDAYRGGSSKSATDSALRPAGHAHGSAGETGTVAAENARPLLQPDGKHEAMLYLGTPYSKIADEWLGHKQPEPGTRHLTSLKLAIDLRYVCDNNPKLIKQILMEQPFVKQMIEERGENIDQTIESAMGYKMHASMPKRMAEAVEKASCKGEEKKASQGALPLQQWGEEIRQMAKHFPCLSEAIYGLSEEQYPAAMFVAAAFFGTLMTRCTYRFYHRPDEERRLNYCVVVIGDPASGKSFATRLYKQIAAPIRYADQVGYDAINRYKRERQERTTSSKAQKGDALKKPQVVIRDHPARTSNAQFIQDMIGAVETVDGKQMNLHLLTFDSELDNATLTQRGGSWIDKSSMELKAFHNEEDGQAYANLDAVNGVFNVYWNFVYTGTPLALNRKVTEANFGSGLATRLAVIPLPPSGFKMMELTKVAKVDFKADGTLKEWAYKLDQTKGKLPLWPLVEHCWEWTSNRMAMAEIDSDKAMELLIKRVAYYGIGISTPFIMMRHWKEWKEKQTFEIDDTDKQLCTLALNIQMECQKHFFGTYAENYFADMENNYKGKRNKSKADALFYQLPDEFTHQDVMKVYGCKRTNSYKIINNLLTDKKIVKDENGKFKKKS